MISRRHLRSLFIALTVLALSTGLVAGREMPAAADDGLATAAEAAGRTVPVGPPADEAVVAPVAGEGDVESGETPAPEDAGDNHGSLVSEAAHAETPDGFRNHGEYVSSIAKGDAGKPETAGQGNARSDEAKAKTKTRGGDR